MMKFSLTILVSLGIGIIIFFAWKSTKNINEGIIVYKTSFSAPIVEQDEQDFIEKLENLTGQNKETKLFFNEKTSKWYDSGLYSLHPNKTSKKNVESYIYHNYSLKEVVEISKTPKLIVYDIIRVDKIPKYDQENSIKILNKKCKEVIIFDDSGIPSKKVFYTPDIPYPIGPYVYLGLKGAVLKVEDLQNDRLVLFEAISIESTDVDNILSSVPNLHKMVNINDLKIH